MALWASLRYGVPQGAVLGPLLFSLFTADLQHVPKNCGIHMFADDFQLTYHFTSDRCGYACQAINSDLCDISNWASRNSLKLNPAKCQHLLVGSSSMLQRINVVSIYIDGELITVLDSVRNLGLIMDRHLRFTEYVNKVCRAFYLCLKSMYIVSRTCLTPGLN